MAGNAKTNVSYNTLLGKTSFGPSSRNQSPYSQKPANLNATGHQLLNSGQLSTSITASTSQQRSTANTPLARLQSTMFGQSFSVHNMRKVDQAQPAKPIAPELCLEHIWTEHCAAKFVFLIFFRQIQQIFFVNSREYLEVASHGFLHIDLVGDTYLCYLLARTAKLQLIRLEQKSSSQLHIFGTALSIPAKDAVCLHVR